MLTTFRLLVTAALGVGYLSLAYVAAHPRVDAEYGAHYLHRTANCWVKQAMRAGGSQPVPPASIEVAKLTYPEACRYLRLDWFTIQDWGVWSNGKHVTLRLPPRPSAEAVELVLRGVPAPGPAIRTRFVFGGQTMEAEIPPDATRTVVFPLPPAGPGYDPDMQIYPLGYAVVPEMPDPDRPDSVPAGQTRHIGVGLVAIHYLPALPPASAPGDAVGHQG